jgi:3-dehydroquinate synthase
VVTVRIPLVEQRDASYEIRIGRGLLAELPAMLAERCPAHTYAIITDTQVAALYAAPLTERLRAAGLTVELLRFPAGEARKTRETWIDLSDAMLAARLGRDSAVLALGGGVVGDVAGFVAATYLRGIPYVQLPTSLLAMIDSSVGGKTGIDTPAGKNLVGAFHQPRLVVADLEVLETLPDEEMAAGLAEAIKHGVLGDAAYFAFLERERAAIHARAPEALERLVARSVEIKGDIVARDEREAGQRAVLNFGHTVGHAVEAVSNYAVLHGAAVAIGMAHEARLAERLGVADSGTARRIAALLDAHGLPLALRGTPDALLAAIRSDKKTRGGVVHFSLPQRIGTMHQDGAGRWTMAVAEEDVRAALQDG